MGQRISGALAPWAAGMVFLAIGAGGCTSGPDGPVCDTSYVAPGGPALVPPYLPPHLSSAGLFAVDTSPASYTEVRRSIYEGQSPIPNEVHVAELLNAFRPLIPPSTPERGDEGDLSALVQQGPAPWDPTHVLVRIALHGAPAAVLKARLDFDSAEVAQHRLIGYDDDLPGGPNFLPPDQLAADQAVNLMIDLVPSATGPTGARSSTHWFDLRISYLPAGDVAERKLTLTVSSDTGSSLQADSPDGMDFRFFSAVAAFGLRIQAGGPLSYDAIGTLVSQSLGTDPWGERTELLELIQRAATLAPYSPPYYGRPMPVDGGGCG